MAATQASAGGIRLGRPCVHHKQAFFDCGLIRVRGAQGLGGRSYCSCQAKMLAIMFGLPRILCAAASGSSMLLP